jgi:hypothetical protein
MPRHGIPRILTNLPYRLPVVDGEAELIEGYLSDLLSAIIANDNDEQ